MSLHFESQTSVHSCLPKSRVCDSCSHELSFLCYQQLSEVFVSKRDVDLAVFFFRTIHNVIVKQVLTRADGSDAGRWPLHWACQRRRCRLRRLQYYVSLPLNMAFSQSHRITSNEYTESIYLQSAKEVQDLGITRKYFFFRKAEYFYLLFFLLWS